MDCRGADETGPWRHSRPLLPCCVRAFRFAASMIVMTADLVVIHEHPEGKKPFSRAWKRRGTGYEPFNVTHAAFTNVDTPQARLYFNQASPSAYVRGNTRAV